MGPHPAEIKLAAPAGSVILFNNADLWHSGTFNYSPAPRLAVTAGLLRGRAPVDDMPAGP
jgi:ectoine hydroxylase-related dioxygenase (phytanoyl-CoA dioxygenase family)